MHPSTRLAAVAGRALGTCVVGVLFLGPMAGQDRTASEASVKAAFLYNFARLATWPDRAWSGPEEPFLVSVVGHDPLGEALDDAFRGKRIGTHPVVVRRALRVEDAGICHLLYLPHSGDLAKALAAHRDRPTLLVGEESVFTQSGGTIAFYKEITAEGLKVRFEVNVDAVRRSGVSLSSKLLGLARIVRDPP